MKPMFDSCDASSLIFRQYGRWKKGTGKGAKKVETGSKRSNGLNFHSILPLDANIDLKSGAPLSALFFPTTILSKYEARGITRIKNGLHSAHGSDYTVR